MYKNVLIPTLIGDDENLKKSVDTARCLLAKDGKITLLNVIEDLPVYVEAYVPADAFEDKFGEVETALNKTADSLGDDVEARVVKGHAGRTILSEASELEADLIVIASHQPGLADYFLGSTAAHVVRRAMCPVFVLR